jgi:hypothetical protein
MTEELPIPTPGLSRGFRQSTRRLVLRSPNGARIVLDADQAVIQMFGINGNLLAELDAAQEFFGDSLFVQKIYDSAGDLRSQWSGLQLFIAGNDGRVEMKAGSSGTDNSMPQITFLPEDGTADGRVKGQPEPNNGASLTIDSPALNGNGQSQIVLYAESDSDPSQINILASLLEITAAVDIIGAVDVTGNVVMSGDLTVTGNDIDGSGTGTLNIGASQPIVAIGANAAFNQLFIGSSGNATDIQKDARSTGWNYEAVTDLAIADTDTSATFNAIAGVATTSFVKERVNTRVGSGMASTWFTTGANTGAEFGLNFNNGAGTNVTVTHSREQKTPASSRSGSTVGFAETQAATLPQGTYTVTAMWRRFTGAGTNTVDANDSCSFYVREEIQA